MGTGCQQELENSSSRRLRIYSALLGEQGWLQSLGVGWRRCRFKPCRGLCWRPRRHQRAGAAVWGGPGPSGAASAPVVPITPRPKPQQGSEGMRGSLYSLWSPKPTHSILGRPGWFKFPVVCQDFGSCLSEMLLSPSSPVTTTWASLQMTKPFPVCNSAALHKFIPQREAWVVSIGQIPT